MIISNRVCSVVPAYPFSPVINILRGHQAIYQTLLNVGNTTMFVALMITLLTIVIAYIFPDSFSITVKLFVHIMMLLALTAIKIGYLMRCIGRHGLGVKVL